jgi:hypothetical protein
MPQATQPHYGRPAGRDAHPSELRDSTRKPRGKGIARAWFRKPTTRPVKSSRHH